jgi:uncharacterized protein with PIN domain
MIIDTSALIAILRDEPEAASCAQAIEAAARRRISAVNFVEAGVVIDMSRDPIEISVGAVDIQQSSISAIALLMPLPNSGTSHCSSKVMTSPTQI